MCRAEINKKLGMKKYGKMKVRMNGRKAEKEGMIGRRENWGGEKGGKRTTEEVRMSEIFKMKQNKGWKSSKEQGKNGKGWKVDKLKHC